MIDRANSLICLHQPCSEFVQWTVDQLNQGGLQVLQTFDSEGLCKSLTSCSCSYHGTGLCDCQVVVLLVYGDDCQPASLIVHAYGGRSWLNLVESYQTSNQALEAKIRQILVLAGSSLEISGELPA